MIVDRALVIKDHVYAQGRTDKVSSRSVSARRRGRESVRRRRRRAPVSFFDGEAVYPPTTHVTISLIWQRVTPLHHYKAMRYPIR